MELRHVLDARQFERSWFEHELFPLAERLERTPAARSRRYSRASSSSWTAAARRSRTTLYHARGDELRVVKTLAYPNSLGAFCEAFTDLLGFKRHKRRMESHGLAGYGIPNDM
ncbi:MAG: hypothetical protein ACRDF9_15970 [Candidatus Limnocylindria bacterium]